LTARGPITDAAQQKNKNNKYNKTTAMRLSRNYMTVEEVSTQRQLIAEYINIYAE
jgi:hypothetical protein